jgi:predicted acylesterase/phospholipase RssA
MKKKSTKILPKATEKKILTVRKKPVYEASLAIAGGGCKALYAMGIGCKLRKWGVQIKEISGVSAGAAMALGILSETEDESIEYFSELTKRNNSNFQVMSLFQGKSPFPHENIYRRLIRHGMNLEKVRKSKVKIYIGTVQAIPKKSGINHYWDIAKLVTETTRAYLLDENDKEQGIPCNRVSKIMERWNMQSIIYTNKDLKSAEIIESIVLNSSSIPPVVSFQNNSKVYFLDGGLTNNLLLEKFSKKSKKIGIYYEDTTIFGKDRALLESTFLIKPSRKLPISSFDYTDPIAVKDCYEMGKEDVEKLKSEILNFCRKE